MRVIFICGSSGYQGFEPTNRNPTIHPSVFSTSLDSVMIQMQITPCLSPSPTIPYYPSCIPATSITPTTSVFPTTLDSVPTRRQTAPSLSLQGWPSPSLAIESLFPVCCCVCVCARCICVYCIVYFFKVPPRAVK